MGKDEQVEEREVLESIFPEEITDISETEFRVKIALEPPEDPNGVDPALEEPPTMLLHVRYPEDYPDVPPTLDLLADASSPSHPRFSVAEDRDSLLSGLDETVQENLGMAMVFTLVTALKEAAEQLIADRQGVETARREEAAQAAEREENKKFQGEAVTAESFLRWREGFLREMEEKERREEEERLADLKKQRVKDAGADRLTGKQLWERGLVGKGDVDDEGEGDDGGAADAVEKLKVSA